MKRFILFERRVHFFRRFGFPFIIILLIGIIAYLGSVIGRSAAERKAIDLLIQDSVPRGVFTLPSATDAKKWALFSFDFGGISFKYPPNWRTLPGETRGIIREGEDAIISTEATDANINGESMIAYRVARIAALTDLEYPVQMIEEADIAGRRALVLAYKSPEGRGLFYEITFLERGFFYTILLGIRNISTEIAAESIVDEYRAMLSTITIK